MIIERQGSSLKMRTTINKDHIIVTLHHIRQVQRSNDNSMAVTKPIIILTIPMTDTSYVLIRSCLSCDSWSLNYYLVPSFYFCFTHDDDSELDSKHLSNI